MHAVSYGVNWLNCRHDMWSIFCTRYIYQIKALRSIACGIFELCGAVKTWSERLNTEVSVACFSALHRSSCWTS